jgi:Fur family ferric uptake transcriptional regulator
MPYTTKQQQAVLACLSQGRQAPMSAMELAEALRRSGHTVGLSTIYRQLEKLEHAGHIHKVNTEEGALYQYCDHRERDCFLIKCQGCGRILHLDCAQLKPFYDHLERDHHFLIDPRATLFSGLCDRCAAGRKEVPFGEE